MNQEGRKILIATEHSNNAQTCCQYGEQPEQPEAALYTRDFRQVQEQIEKGDCDEKYHRSAAADVGLCNTNREPLAAKNDEAGADSQEQHTQAQAQRFDVVGYQAFDFHRRRQRARCPIDNNTGDAE